MLREIYQNFKAGQLVGKSKAQKNWCERAKDEEVRELEREVLEALKRLKERINQ